MNAATAAAAGVVGRVGGGGGGGNGGSGCSGLRVGLGVDLVVGMSIGRSIEPRAVVQFHVDLFDDMHQHTVTNHTTDQKGIVRGRRGLHR